IEWSVVAVDGTAAGRARAAALIRPDVAVRGIDVDAGRRAPLAASRKLTPVPRHGWSRVRQSLPGDRIPRRRAPSVRRCGLRVCLSAFILVLAIVANARADVTRFDLSGTVVDGTGGVLPGASVTLKNVDTGFVRSTVTDDQGRYSFAALNPTGRWTLSVELQ